MPYCKDKSKVHIAWLKDVEEPDNVEIISYGKTIKHPTYTDFFWTYLNYNTLYMIKAQLYTIRKFFTTKFDTAILYNIYDLPFLLLCKIFGKKVIYAIVDDYPQLTPSKYWQDILTFNEKWFIKLSNKCFCTAKALKTKTPKAIYIPNSIRGQKLTRLVHNTPQNRVGILGSIGKWIETPSINYAATHLPQTTFDIIGDGERLQDIQDLPNIKKHGFLPHEKAFPIMQKWTCAIIPFELNKITHSVSPIKLFEYFNLELPVITTPTQELIQYKDIIFYYNNPQELVERIQYLQKNPSIAKEKGKKGRRFIEQNTWETLTPQYEALL